MMVPNGWVEARVKDIIKSLDAGISVNSEDDNDLTSEFKILKTSCVSKGEFAPDKVKSVKETIEIKRLKEPVLSNTIIISRMNTPLLVGANAYVELAEENTFLPDRLWQVKPKDSKVDMRWLGYWFGSSHTRYILSSNATGTSGSMKNITKPDVMSMILSVPPLPEQRKIAKILIAWDRGIATTEKLIDASKQQKKALMQQLLTGKKRLLSSPKNGAETGKAFEGDWAKKRLKDIVSITYGKSPKEIFDANGQYHVIGTGGVTGRTNNILCSNPAVIIGRKGTIDKPQFITSPFWAIDTTFYLLPINENTHIDWFYYLTQTFNLKKYNEASGVPSLSRETLYSICIEVSCLKEQQKIASVLTAADKEIELLQAKLAHFKKEKQALMQQLLTGKRRVFCAE